MAFLAMPGFNHRVSSPLPSGRLSSPTEGRQVSVTRWVTEESMRVFFFKCFLLFYLEQKESIVTPSHHLIL